MDAFREQDTLVVRTLSSSGWKPNVLSLPVGILEKDSKPTFGHYLCSFGYKRLIVVALNGHSK